MRAPAKAGRPPHRPTAGPHRPRRTRRECSRLRSVTGPARGRRNLRRDEKVAQSALLSESNGEDEEDHDIAQPGVPPLHVLPLLRQFPSSLQMHRRRRPMSIVLLYERRVVSRCSGHQPPPSKSNRLSSDASGTSSPCGKSSRRSARIIAAGAVSVSAPSRTSKKRRRFRTEDAVTQKGIARDRRTKRQDRAGRLVICLRPFFARSRLSVRPAIFCVENPTGPALAGVAVRRSPGIISRHPV